MSAKPLYHPGVSRLYRISGFLILGIFFLASAASATEYVLNATTMAQFSGGIMYTGSDPLVIEIAEDVTIAGTGNSGIDSTAPVIIRSCGERTLNIFVNNDTDMLYGIKAPSVSLESGVLNITVNGKNDGEKGNAFAIWAGAGNATIAGGSVFATVATTGHKNKGIYASRYVTVSGGCITASQYGGKNTFGLDGGDVENGDTDGGIAISGGTVVVSSSGGSTRNYGIDSKFGIVRISGNPVILISEDGSGAKDNFAYNPNITTISGGNAVVFAREGVNYSLRSDAALSRNATLLPGQTFEIPPGLTLAVSKGASLLQPEGTVFLFGNGYGAFTYSRSLSGADGAISYFGNDVTRQAPVPLVFIPAGLGIAFLLIRRN